MIRSDLEFNRSNQNLFDYFCQPKYVNFITHCKHKILHIFENISEPVYTDSYFYQLVQGFEFIYLFLFLSTVDKGNIFLLNDT